MELIPIVSYNELLTYAKNFYSAVAQGDSETMEANYKNFFQNANKINPSIAKMSLQQAQNDVFTHIVADYMEDKIGEANFKAARKNIFNMAFQLNRSLDIINLDKSIRETYPKTGSKRLAIITCLADGEELGLAECKKAKGMKKFQYMIRKLLKR